MVHTFESIEQFLFSRASKEFKLGLRNVTALSEIMGRPQDRFPSIHIAGTNGKGSTSALIESVLRSSGYNTGLYISPHLVTMRERIQIRGTLISREEVVDLFRALEPHIAPTGVTFFEILTMMAFLSFIRHGVNAAVLEVGLGGRLDATNIVTPLLTVITDIGLDHMHILGHSLNEIALEKAGILKKGIPCISGARRASIRNLLEKTARSKQAPISFSEDLVRISKIRLLENGCRLDARCGSSAYHDLFVGLAGQHQVRNAGVALLAVEKLREMGWRIPDEAVAAGFRDVHWPARLQLLPTVPKLLLDSAHNPGGMRSLVQALKTIFSFERLHLVFGVLEDKNYRQMLSAIAPLACRVTLTQPLNARALAPEKLLSHSSLQGKPAEAAPDIGEAVARAMAHAGTNDLVVCAGSMFFVGEVLRLWQEGKLGPGNQQIKSKKGI